MGFLDRLLGREDSESSRNGRGDSNAEQAFGRGRGQRTDDEIALERYRYLLKTAPPETIEQVHAEAFARLTPEQRRQVYEDLAAGSDRPAGDDPESLARSATRSEIRQPGTLERAFGGNRGDGGNFNNGGNRGGPGFGSMVGSSILGTVAGYVIGSAIVSSFMPNDGYGNGDGSGDGGGDGSDGSADGGTAEAASADSGDSGGWGGDSGGWGDGGGGDFGGGDFGGGDF